MKKNLPLALIVSCLLISCEGYEIPDNYPTTLTRLSPGLLSDRRALFASQNQYLSTSINDYGFIDYAGDPKQVGLPPYIGVVTQSQATDVVKLFVSKYASETGVKNADDLGFYQVSTSTGYGGAIGWTFKTVNQKTDSIEVMNTMIFFHLTNGVITSCYQHWYPEIFIPASFNISQEKAKARLVGRVISYSSISGAVSYRTVKLSDLEGASFNVKVLPVESTDKIELHVCWKIHALGLAYIFYVDVMTGEIVGEYTTMIS